VVTSLYLDLMESNTRTAHVSIRSLSLPHTWAYEIRETDSAPPVRGTVEWNDTPGLGLLAMVLNDYALR
jgi:hypothetical protein